MTPLSSTTTLQGSGNWKIGPFWHAVGHFPFNVVTAPFTQLGSPVLLNSHQISCPQSCVCFLALVFTVPSVVVLSVFVGAALPRCP